MASFWSKEEDRILLVGLALACAALLSFAFYFTRQSSQALLSLEAEATAVRWADYLGRELKNASILFDRRELSQDNKLLLRHLHGLGNTFAFELYDLDGRPILTPSKLGNVNKNPDSRKVDKTAKSVAVNGKPLTEVMAESQQGRPFVYSRSYVPFSIAGQVFGAIKVLVDQTSHAAVIREKFAKLAFAITVVMVLGSSLAAAIVLGKIRQRKK